MGIYIRKPFSEEHKRKIGEANKGKRHIVSEETKRKIGKSHKGKHLSEEHKKKLSEINKGNKNGLGYRYTEKQKRKLSEAMKGHLTSEETRKKLSEAFKGEKSSSWRGGISFEPYAIDWTKTLKRAIRERDKYTCQICGKEPAVYCHHIDYDKKNCNSDNLITLCHSCHSKTNFNRKYWINYFKGLTA